MLSRIVLVCFIPLFYGMVVNSADVDPHGSNLKPIWKRADRHTGDTSFSDDDGHPISSLQDTLNAPGNIDIRDEVLQVISKQLANLIDSFEDRYKKLEHQTKETSQIVRGLEKTLNTVESDTFFLRVNSKRMQDDISSIGSCCDNHSKSDLGTESKIEKLQESVHDVRLFLGSVLDQLLTIKRNTKIVELKNTADQMFNMTKTSADYEETLPADCWDVLQNGYKSSGVHTIRPPSRSADSFNAYCDMKSHGGGWTVFQNHNTGELDFNKNWNEYKLGFGDLRGEFWLGLENVHQMTSHQEYELLIEMKDYDAEKISIQYDAFVIGSESEKYPIRTLRNYTGYTGDPFREHAGQKFSTFDADNDNYPNNCAALLKGGWWYRSCTHCNLNGEFSGRKLPERTAHDGAYWQKKINNQWVEYSLKETRMSIRPRQRRH